MAEADKVGPEWTYTIIKMLGQGTFGVVVLAKIEETNETVAIKRIRVDDRLHNRELAIMRDVLMNKSGSPMPTPPLSSSRLGRHSPNTTTTAPFLLSQHPNIVQLKANFTNCDPHSNERYLNLVMSYLPTDLYTYKKQILGTRKSNTHKDNTTTTGASAASRVPNFFDTDSGKTSIPPSPLSGSGNGSAFSSRRLPLLTVKLILFQLARALAFLHARHVCHRDIKPANILLDPETWRLQLCDFGSAKEIHPGREERNVCYICSRYYRAPELLFGALHYNTEVDMWSYGCIAAELLRDSGRPLFKGSTTVDQMAEIFKVLGAPSKEELHTMNPQCAAAMESTHAHLYMGGGASRQAASPAPEPETDPHHHHHHHHHDDSDYRDDNTEEALEGDHGEDYEQMYDVLKIRALPIQKILSKETPASGVALVRQLLAYTPAKRLSAVDVVQHPFFNDLFSADAAGKLPSEVDEESTAATAVPTVAPLPCLPGGKCLPIEMFLLTAEETHLYSPAFQEKMSREAWRIKEALLEQSQKSS